MRRIAIIVAAFAAALHLSAPAGLAAAGATPTPIPRSTSETGVIKSVDLKARKLVLAQPPAEPRGPLQERTVRWLDGTSLGFRGDAGAAAVKEDLLPGARVTIDFEAADAEVARAIWIHGEDQGAKPEPSPAR